MSTLSKLDPQVRRNRSTRMMIRRGLQRDVKLAQAALNGMKRNAPTPAWTYIKTVEGETTAILAGTYKLDLERYKRAIHQVTIELAASAIALNGLTKISKDSSRTGERKHFIYKKLGAL